MEVYYTKSASETAAIARGLGEVAVGGEVYALFGDLGAGKTAFTAGFASGCGYNGRVYSPTYALVNEYVGGRVPVYHFDMYRVETADDLYSTGFYEYLDMGGVMVIEWSENIEDELPCGYIRVELARGGAPDERTITVERTGK